MKTPNSSTHLQKVGKRLTLSGSLRDRGTLMSPHSKGWPRWGKTISNLFSRWIGDTNIADIIRLALFFPRFVEEEGNRDLFVEVTEEELKEMLHNLQKDKSPGPDGWTVEFYLGFFELLRC
jgi:hypothetical protein